MNSTIKIVLFLTLIYFSTQQGFDCPVSNCSACSFPYFCGLCQNNFALTLNTTSGFNYCNALTCPYNCTTCYQNNICSVCNNNTFITMNGSCSPNPSSNATIPANCMWGTNNMTCNLCNYGYSLQAGYCYPTITFTMADQNCMVKMTSSICQICKSGYIVGFLGYCIQNQFNSICTQQNCAYCQNSTGQCLLCYQPFQLTSSGICVAAVCNINSCSLCTNTTQCQTCYPGYVLINNTCQIVGYGCNVSNCQTCSNSQSCGQCSVGYQLSPFQTLSNTVYLCTKIVCPFNITNCNVCTQNYNSIFLYNQILCAPGSCNTNYIYVHGYCVANYSNLTNQPTHCDLQMVPNCITCSTSNFCNQCQVGYTLTRYGTCMMTTCTVFNCQACSINNICQLCNQNYTLTIGNLSLFNSSSNMTNFLNYIGTQQCVVTSNIICNIMGCQYCFYNNKCQMCIPGYMISSNNTMCTPTCNITNCNQCNTTSNINCLACQPGYNLSSNGLQCVMINYTCANGCSNTTGSCFYNWNTNMGQCLLCNTNMLLYNGQCYSLNCNIYGCNMCAPWAANNTLCLRCSQGLVLSDGYCITLNCNNNVSNCVNCIQNGTCIGCSQGYLLQTSTNGTVICTQANIIQRCFVSNCLACQPGNPSMCTVCANPYVNNTDGMCVCKFQNCLDCSQNSLSCSSCPPPLFASQREANCAPQPSLNNNCSATNCQFCFAPGKCAICAIGYQLQRINYTCLLNNCTNANLSNCQYCDQFGYQCQLCQQGYMINNFLQGGSCLPINQGYTCNITGCAVCSSTNNSICVACLPTYQYSIKTTNYCTVFSCNISNCYLCLANNSCTVCLSGYYLGLNMQCVPKFSQIINCQGQISYCAMCVTGLYNPPSNTSYCIKCLNGFQYNMASGKCLPQQNSIPNCLVQMPNFNLMKLPACVMCQQGYFVNAFTMCSPYSPQPANSNCSVYNCMYCGVNSSTCSFCFVPWGITATGTCLTNASNICGTSCLSCLNTTICLNCIQGYLPYTNGSCVNCNIASCNYCQNSSICSNCITGYYLAPNGLCIACNISGCSACSNNNVCSNCTNNMKVPNYLGNQCVTCNVANCISCYADNLCLVCSSGYQLYIMMTNNTNISSCVLCTVTNCAQCNLNGTCTSCLTGYSLSNQNCNLCNYPCAQCNSNGSCYSCVTPAFVATPYNGSCMPSSIPNCATYNSSSSCSVCNPGYIYNGTLNMCVYQCNSTCVTCNASNPNQCYTCVLGYYKTTNNICMSCNSTGCNTCNATQCLTCSNGFYLYTGECKLCPGYCANCLSATICTQLINQNNQALVTINSQTYLAICSQGCISCSNLNPQICLGCAGGLYLNSQSVCQLCNEKCLTCNSTNANMCLSCYPNSYLSNNTCIICSSNCQTCSINNISSCMSCYPGFYLGSNNTCMQGCPLNCQYCSSNNICTQCSSGFTLFNTMINNISQTVCAPCTLNCQICASNAPSSCALCAPSYYPSGNTCIACTTNCATCTSAGCSQCIQGYFLNSASTCSINCQLPCATCSANNPTKCTSCIAGYLYSSIVNTCMPLTSCAGACTVCPIGYILVSGQCIQCTTSNCQQCNSTNVTQCFACAPSYFYANQQCQSCMSSCATCLRSDGCTTCASGYTYNSLLQIQTSGYRCMPCQYPCNTCQGSVNYCTSCVSGFAIIGSTCTQTFYFGFGMYLNTNASFFNQQYYKFITALSQAVGSSNPNVVSITGISFGSVIVAGQVAPSGTSGTLLSNQQFYDLDSSLQSNTIADMTISVLLLQVVGGTIQYTGTNLALILGIVIPVGVLIIAGIALYLYRKNRTRSIIIERKIEDDSKYNQRQSFQLSGSYKQEQNSNRPL